MATSLPTRLSLASSLVKPHQQASRMERIPVYGVGNRATPQDILAARTSLPSPLTLHSVKPLRGQVVRHRQISPVDHCTAQLARSGRPTALDPAFSRIVGTFWTQRTRFSIVGTLWTTHRSRPNATAHAPLARSGPNASASAPLARSGRLTSPDPAHWPRPAEPIPRRRPSRTSLTIVVEPPIPFASSTGGRCVAVVTKHYSLVHVELLDASRKF